MTSLLLSPTVVNAGVLENVNDTLSTISDKYYTYFLIYVLIGVGLYFTVRTRALQIRLFPRLLQSIVSQDDPAESNVSISSFQAFAIGLASRVGTGNIVGVAIAIIAGGPGAVFWMWMVALVGMATAFIEATLAQLFKISDPDGTFRGGPAYYITRGLKSKAMATVFAVIIIFVFGFAYEATQSNTIAKMFESTFDLPTWATGLILVAITAPIIFGGVRQVAKVTEWLAPLMALGYVLIAIIIMVLNLGAIPEAIGSIFRGAFGVDQALWGTTGGVAAALLNGVRRGLFSNEAGEGSAPNAAATASVSHPVQQGFIQSMGVFVDTIVICTATALIILLSGVYSPETAGSLDSGTLTSNSVTASLGGWAEYLMTLMIFVFAYSSLLGNFTYAEINSDYLRGPGHRHVAVRLMILVATYVGAIASLDAVWTLADISMGIMALINIVAIILLGKWAFGALRDWEAQRAKVLAGEQDYVHFISTDNPYLPGELPGDVWAKNGEVDQRVEANQVANN